MEEIEFIEEQEELNVDLPETNLKLGSTKGHDNANSKKRGRGQTMKQAAQLQTLEKLHEKQDKRKQVARELNIEETEFTEEQEVQEELNVDLPETNQELGSTEGHYNGFKCRLKRDYYKPYKTYKMRWKNRPTYVSAEHFKWLLKQWNDLEDQDRAKINAANRAKQRDMHTCGPKSFARIRENLARMEKIASQQAREHVEGGESSNLVDPFEVVMGKEHKGHLRLYGRGVTASTLGKVSARSSVASVYVPDELLKSIKEDTMAHQLKKLHPQWDINAEAFRRLAMVTQSPGDASSAEHHRRGMPTRPRAAVVHLVVMAESGELMVVRGSKLKEEFGISESLGTVVLVVRPPKEEVVKGGIQGTEGGRNFHIDL
ncbi:hypothetical protein Dimus_003840, partial [Dionaea muscipula]